MRPAAISGTPQTQPDTDVATRGNKTMECGRRAYINPQRPAESRGVGTTKTQPTHNGVRRGTKLLKEEHAQPTELHRAEGAWNFNGAKPNGRLFYTLTMLLIFAQSGRVELWHTSVGRLVYRHRQY